MNIRVLIFVLLLFPEVGEEAVKKRGRANFLDFPCQRQRLQYCNF